MDHPDTSGAAGADSFLSFADETYQQSEILVYPSSWTRPSPFYTILYGYP
jgi:hypothetical protein